MSVTKTDWFVGFFSFIGALLVTPALLLHGGQVYDWAFPVVSNWTPTSITRDGDDLLVKGTMIRHRGECQHLSPPMARLAAGQNIPVISSSPTAGLSWAESDEPQVFGPWRVPGAAKVAVTFYLRHRCHAMWTTVTEIGTIMPKDSK
jgi:hypothetical protein